MEPITITKITDSHGSKKTTVPKEIVERFDEEVDRILWSEDDDGKLIVEIR